jgi:hypothetical protein
MMTVRFPVLARKNDALGQATRSLRARKLFNRRCPSIEERIFDSVNRDKLFLNFVFPRAAERTGNAGKFRCQSLN